MYLEDAPPPLDHIAASLGPIAGAYCAQCACVPVSAQLFLDLPSRWVQSVAHDNMAVRTVVGDVLGQRHLDAYYSGMSDHHPH